MAFKSRACRPDVTMPMLQHYLWTEGPVLVSSYQLLTSHGADLELVEDMRVVKQVQLAVEGPWASASKNCST